MWILLVSFTSLRSDIRKTPHVWLVWCIWCIWQLWCQNFFLSIFSSQIPRSQNFLSFLSLSYTSRIKTLSEIHYKVSRNLFKSIETPTSCDDVEFWISQCRNSLFFLSSHHIFQLLSTWMASSLDLSVSSLPWQMASSLPQPTAPSLNKQPPPLTNGLPSQRTVPLPPSKNGEWPPPSLDKWSMVFSLDERPPLPPSTSGKQPPLLTNGSLPPSTNGKQPPPLMKGPLPPLTNGEWPPPSTNGSPSLPQQVANGLPSWQTAHSPLRKMANGLLPQQMALSLPQQSMNSFPFRWTTSLNKQPTSLPLKNSEWSPFSTNGLPQQMVSPFDEWPFPSLNEQLHPSLDEWFSW